MIKGPLIVNSMAHSVTFYYSKMKFRLLTWLILSILSQASYCYPDDCLEIEKVIPCLRPMIKSNDTEEVDKLLSDLVLQDYGEIANKILIMTASYNRVHMVQMLLDNSDLDINFGTGDESALWWAIRSGSFDAAKLLIENGAETRNIPLEFLAFESDSGKLNDFYSWLLMKKLNLDIDSLFKFALEFDSLNLMKSLIKSNPKHQFDYSNDIFIAIRNKNYEMFRLMIEHDKELFKESLNSDWKFFVHDRKLLRMLQNMGFHLNLTNEVMVNMWDRMHYTDYEAIEFFIDKGLKFNYSNEQLSPLTLTYYPLEIIKLWYENLSIDINKDIPLIQNLATINYLIEKGSL